MQDCERKSRAISTLFTLFKPRQVFLNLKSSMKHQNENGSKTPKSITGEQRLLLLQSICHFLEQSGFSKTLKKFHNEADIEKDSWKSSIINLEEMCYDYLTMRDGNTNGSASEETVKKTKEHEVDEGKKSQAKAENELADNVDVKTKKKKKIKGASDVTEQIAEENLSKPFVFLSVPSETEKKSKDKKKKRKDESEEEKKENIQVKHAELPAEETSEKPDSISREEKKEKSKSRKKKEDTLNPNDSSMETTEAEKEKKVSKKRKKSSSEENESVCVEKAASDDSKRRRTGDLDQSNGITPPKTPDVSANGVLEQDESKESQKTDKSRQYIESTERRTSANAFRRVKEEEVEFVDKRLQDNSYWAKDGADSGYGAKAEEVLGQVRGRDFRHEKTKKKRGSYRGGQIDLQSHSIKFNYDDDNE